MPDENIITLYSEKETVVGGKLNMANESNKTTNVRFLTQLALLSAIIILMALTPIGYIRTPFLTVTLITIPVAVGAIILGPKGGTICGLVFGLTSFYTALTAPSLMMGAFMSVNPVFVAILCIVPRILEGFLCGIIYKGLEKGLKNNPVKYYLAGLSCPVLNTLLFMTTLVLFFYNCEYVVNLKEAFGTTNPFAFVVALVGVQAVIEAVSCGVVAGIVSQALSKVLRK